MMFRNIFSKVLFTVLLSALCFSGCQKNYIKRHYEGQFDCTQHYTYHDINNNNFDTVYYFTCTVSLFPEYPEEYLDDNRKTTPIKIQKDGSQGYLQTEIGRNGEFKSDNFMHGGFYGGFSDNNHFSYTLTNGGLGSSSTSKVTAVRK